MVNAIPPNTDPNHAELLRREKEGEGIQDILEGSERKWQYEENYGGSKDAAASLIAAASVPEFPMYEKLVAFLQRNALHELRRVFPAQGSHNIRALKSRWNTALPEQALEATRALLELTASLPLHAALWEKIKDMWQKQMVPRHELLEDPLFCALALQQQDMAAEPLWEKILATDGQGDDLYPGGNANDGFYGLYCLASNMRTQEGIPLPLQQKVATALAGDVLRHWKNAVAAEDESENETKRQMRMQLRFLFLQWGYPPESKQAQEFLALYHAALAPQDRAYRQQPFRRRAPKK